MRGLHLGVLGAPTATYLPYCYFNLLSPILDVVYGFIGFKVPSTTSATQLPRADERDEATTPAMTPAKGGSSE